MKEIKKKQIILSGIAMGIVAIVLIPVIYLWCAFSPKVADPIALPDIDSIEAIEIMTTDGTVVSYRDKETIDQSLSILAQATPTSKESIQDSPNVSHYGKVDITNNDGVTTVFYYTENKKHYIEQPYQGIYETGVGIDAFVLGEITE